MITLITGTPGTGKTAWVINEILTFIDNEKKELRKNPAFQLTEFYIHGIRNLRGIAYTQIFCKSPLCDICRAQDKQLDEHIKNGVQPYYVENWHQWKTPKSIIVVDEVQRIWRPRGGTGKPPEDISLLETHRHYGVDFWLISQGPHLFDNFIRLLIGRHIHLVAKWNGRHQYEWPECKQSTSSTTDAVTRPYKLPKRVYKLYDSAEVHTKQAKRVPMALFFMFGAVCVAVFLVARIFINLAGNHPKPDEQKTVEQQKTTETMRAEIENQLKSVPMDTPEHIQAAFTPVINSLPWTAPVYKDLAKVVSMPKIKGCINRVKENANKCSCYTQQATVVDIPESVCRLYLKQHAFDPFKPDSQPQQQFASTDTNAYPTTNRETKRQYNGVK